VESYAKAAARPFDAETGWKRFRELLGESA
jgi:hypothetical protein